MLYELGIVGFALLLVLLAVARTPGALPQRFARREAPRVRSAICAACWLAALLGALAGAALFGGSPIAGIFWLTLGVVAAAGSMSQLPARERTRSSRSCTPSPG